jgi:hypothetical protein
MAGRLANLEEDMLYMASKEYCEEYCDELASSTRRYLKALDGGMQVNPKPLHFNTITVTLQHHNQ